jgi:hypothetical protein
MISLTYTHHPSLPQAWIAKVVATETRAETIPLDHLVAGNQQAFISLHMTAMLSLVSDPVERISDTTVPETLLFDVRRLSRLQFEFDRIVSGASIVVAANHTVPSPAFVAELGALVAEGQPDFDAIIGTNVAERLNTLVPDANERRRVLGDLRSMVADKTNNAVRNVM